MKYFLIFIISWICLQAQALTLPSQFEHVDLSPDLEMLEDASGTLRLSDIQATGLSDQFKTITQSSAGAPSLGFSHSAYWVRIGLQTQSNDQDRYVLEIPNSSIDEIDFYDASNPVILSGIMRPLNGQKIQTRFFDFPLNVGPTTKYVYLRIKSSNDLAFSVELWSQKAFFHKMQKDNFLQALYYGEIIGLMFFNLFIYIALSDKRYLLYFIFSLFTFLGIFSGNGFGRLYLWPSFGNFDRVAQNLFFSFSGFFSILFSSEFLGTGKMFKKFHLTLMSYAGVFATLGFLYLISVFWSFNLKWLNTIFYISTCVLPGFFIYGGIQSLRSGSKVAHIYLIAWGVLCFGILVASLRPFGLVPTNGYTSYAMQISSSIEMLLLSLSLAQLIQYERKINNALQLNVIDIKQKLIDEMNQSNAKLEAAVTTRTREIELSANQNRALHNQFVRFGSLIAHEFRNPLGIIDSQIALMRKEIEKKIVFNESRLDVIVAATRRLTSLFEHWLHGDKLTTELIDINVQPILINQWLNDFVRNNPAFSLNHEIKIIYAKDIKYLFADEELFTIALSNLIDNACKFSPIGSTITIQTFKRQSSVGVFVIDRGVGIDNANHKDIFEDFFRIKHEANYPGLGLGLQFVKRIMQAHAGSVELHSRLGSGSRFELWFNSPVNPVADAKL